jgi:hypothetical protein
MKNQLKANNIEYYEREGIVKTVIQALKLANLAGSGDGKKAAAPYHPVMV